SMVVTASILKAAESHVVDSIGARLPDIYHDAVRGMQVNSQTGSCCRAVTDRNAVVIADVTIDPQWSRFSAFIAPLGFRSAWSTPVVGSDGKILATFANYGKTPQQPTASDTVFVDGITRTVALAIERSRAEATLR